MEVMKTMMASMTPEQQKESMGKWGEWLKKNAASFADMGAPVGKNTQVIGSASSAVSNDIGGYSIVQAESVEAVVELLKSSPHVAMPGTTTDVMEIMSMPGM